MLREFIRIRKKLITVDAEPALIRGTLMPDDEDIAAIQILANSNCADRYVRKGTGSVTVDNLVSDGEEVRVELFPNGLLDGKYYEKFESLVNQNKTKYPQTRFYVHELCFDSNEEIATPEVLRNFEAVTKFIQLLTDRADYSKDHDLVFVTNKALIVEIEYDATDIPNGEIVATLVHHISAAAHKEERSALLIHSMTDMLVLPEKSQRFAYLLQHFSDLTDSYNKSYILYVEQYSFHKVKAELDKELLELGDEIQGVINDAQTKLIAIPAAFLLIVSQFDYTGEKLGLNVGLAIAACIFGALLEVLLRNQFASLDFIKDSIESFKKSLSNEKKNLLADELAGAFTKIEQRRSKQETYLQMIRVLVWLTPIVAVLLLTCTVLSKVVFASIGLIVNPTDSNF